MKARQTLQQNQQLAMTPQLLQQIRLLQLSRLELEQTLSTALETNVLLEADDGLDEMDTADAVTTDDYSQDEIAEAYDASWDQPAKQGSSDYDPLANLEDSANDLFSLLRAQIEQEFYDLTEKAIALLLVSECDECGYLNADFASLTRRLCKEFGSTPKRVELILKRVQQLDPVGVAARSLCECLTVQLMQLPDKTPGLELAIKIVNEDLAILSEHNHETLAARFETTVEEARAAEQLILALNPKPGDDAKPSADCIYPDVVVRHSGQQWRVELARERIPKLRVNPTYERLMSSDSSAGAHEGLRDQLAEARWIVRGLEIRNDTLSRAAAVIFERQKKFLEIGIEGLAPLTLREVADAIGMHESTICRITNNKYVQTPRGVYELKFFFSSQLTRKDGTEIAGAAVRAMVSKIIDKEDRTRPLSDGVIAKMLARKGICIARRTVAKYREALSIGPARQRAIPINHHQASA